MTLRVTDKVGGFGLEARFFDNGDVSIVDQTTSTEVLRTSLVEHPALGKARRRIRPRSGGNAHSAMTVVLECLMAEPAMAQYL